MIIKISEDYSKYPIGRFPDDGDYSGARFRDEYLYPKLNEIIAFDKNEKLIVNLDGVRSFGSSFLEEAFGGLIRRGYFTREQLKNKLVIEYTQKNMRIFADLIKDYIDKAKFDSSSEP